MSYKIFTTEFDEIRHVSQEMEGVSPDFIINAEHYLKTCSSDISELAFPQGAPAPVFLVDCSGSMRGHSVLNTVFALQSIGDALHDAGLPFEILGFTTKNWKGGNSREKWLMEGRPSNPGRLNDTLHLVIKGMSEDWTDTRKNLLYLFTPGILKENVDGEAYEWAHNRIRSRSERQVFIPISDGFPYDGSTLSLCSASFMQDHLNEVVEAIDQSEIPTQGVYIDINKRDPSENALPDPIVISHPSDAQEFLDSISGAMDIVMEQEHIIELKV